MLLLLLLLRGSSHLDCSDAACCICDALGALRCRYWHNISPSLREATAPAAAVTPVSRDAQWDRWLSLWLLQRVAFAELHVAHHDIYIYRFRSRFIWDSWICRTGKWRSRTRGDVHTAHDEVNAKKIQNFSTWIVRFSGLANLNMLSEIIKEPRKLPWETNLDKNKQKLHRFQFCAKNEDFFTRIVRFSGSANSNMLTKISREPRELPWQPNLSKNKQKTQQFQFCAKKSSNQIWAKIKQNWNKLGHKFTT